MGGLAGLWVGLCGGAAGAFLLWHSRVAWAAKIYYLQFPRRGGMKILGFAGPGRSGVVLGWSCHLVGKWRLGKPNIF